jgi:hypothetical protein
MGTNTFEHTEFKSENFPHRRPAVFSQTAILSSLISQQIFSFVQLTSRMDEDTRLHNSKRLIPIQGESKKTDTFDIQMNNKGVSFFWLTLYEPVSTLNKRPVLLELFWVM